MTCPNCQSPTLKCSGDGRYVWCENPACSANQSSAPSPRSDVGENDLGGGELRCRKCGGEMRFGQALVNTPTGSPDFYGDTGFEQGCTITLNGPCKMIGCMKCAECGWSVTLVEEPPKPPHESESPEPPSAERGTPAVPEEFTRDDMARAWEEGNDTGIAQGRGEMSYEDNPYGTPAPARDVLNKEVGNV